MEQKNIIWISNSILLILLVESFIKCMFTDLTYGYQIIDTLVAIGIIVNILINMGSKNGLEFKQKKIGKSLNLLSFSILINFYLWSEQENLLIILIGSVLTTLTYCACILFASKVWQEKSIKK